MTVSVLMPTLGMSQTMANAVGSVLASLEVSGGGELLLIADGDTAFQRLAGAQLPNRVRMLRGPGRGAASARNLGLLEARHEIVLFTDDDCIVPLEWAAKMADGARRWGASAGPVQVPRRGPITSFLDHQRPFDAPPLNSKCVRYLVTANASVRMDAMPASGFRDDLFNNACEDAELGYALRDNGLDLVWSGDSAPVVHQISEHIGEIVDRWFRYGAANARIAWHLGRWEESVPDADSWLREITDGAWRGYQRYFEIQGRDSQAMFATLSIVQTASFLMGYLSAVGDLSGCSVIVTDRTALAAASSRILDGAPEVIVARSVFGPADNQDRDWGEPDIEKLSAAVAASCVLMAPNRTAAEFLARWRDAMVARQREIHASSIEAWRSVGAGADLGLILKSLRAQGVSFADGMHEIEKGLMAGELV